MWHVRPKRFHAMNQYIRWFSELGLADIPSVAERNASLGELFRELTPKGISVPPGFAVTADAYRAFSVPRNSIRKLRRQLAGLDVRDIEDPPSARGKTFGTQSWKRNCPRTSRRKSRKATRN
jgi:pyruvate,water dikinase